MGIEEYRAFIAGKRRKNEMRGFKPKSQNPRLKTHQKNSIEFTLERVSAALFLDTGLGKSLCELEWAREVAEETKRPVIIFTPLAVAPQMVSEAEKFGIEARQIKEQKDVGIGINVCNYERLKHLDPEAFGGVVLDESSILKGFAGQTRKRLLDAFEKCDYKLAATATPSPNDHMELGNHAEFLGVMRMQEMLSQWFINDTSTASQEWRLKGHAADDFWQWVASWSRCATLPSDLGGDDTGYVLPPVDTNLHIVEADRTASIDDGMLFRIPEMSATSFHREKRLTLNERCEKTASLANHDDFCVVWCETNDESAKLAQMVDGSHEVRGDMKPDEKEELLTAFSNGEYRAIVTKPKIAGMGLNWQHCAHSVFGSLSFSFEQYYQATRRLQRFGQERQVRNDLVISDTERPIWETQKKKAAKNKEMKARMSEAMKRAQNGGSVMEIYNRPLDLAFPEWVKEG